jgi:two-component system chemotaxis sensor kinase CheA
MSASAHEAETRLACMRDDPAQPWDLPALESDLARIERLLARYRHVNDEVLGRKGSFEQAAPGYLVLSPNELGAVLEDARAAENDPRRATALAHRLRERAALSCRELLAAVLDGLPSVAEKVGKPPPVVRFEGDAIGLSPVILAPIRDGFVHLLTNAIDHGIDAPEARRARGLPAAGTITVATARAPDGGAELWVWDDGPGLDVAGLRQRTGEPEADDDAVAEAIFRSGTSSKDAVTLNSGRGVGMDAARRLAESIEGSLSVKYAGPTTAGGRRPIRLCFRVPARHVWRPFDATHAAA